MNFIVFQPQLHGFQMNWIAIYPIAQNWKQTQTLSKAYLPVMLISSLQLNLSKNCFKVLERLGSWRDIFESPCDDDFHSQFCHFNSKVLFFCLPWRINIFLGTIPLKALFIGLNVDLQLTCHEISSWASHLESITNQFFLEVRNQTLKVYWESFLLSTH